MHNNQLDAVQDYYSKVLQTKSDLKTTACCSAESMPEHLKLFASQIHPEVLSKFYGCGVPIPPALEGCKVLDLGCGTGRDCFLLSKLVGPHGAVIGIDMTESQLATARNYINETNIRFVHGYIEDLKSADIGDNTIDTVVSNCVINLSPAKERVFSEIFRVLKPGGELYFSDVFCDRRLSEDMRNDQVLLGECLGGAMYIEDFRRLMNKSGCADYRTINSIPITITNSEVKAKIGAANFFSLTIRAFKLNLEDKCEDYGEVAYYRGGIPESPNSFLLDDHHFFEKNKPMLVCSNTSDMVLKTRYQPYFEVIGKRDQHFGLFDCVSPAPQTSSATTGGSCC